MSCKDIYLIVPFSKQNSKKSNVDLNFYGYINVGKVDTSNISLHKFTISLDTFNISNPDKLTANVISSNTLVHNKTATIAHGNYTPFLNLFKTVYENKEMEIDQLHLMKKDSIPKPIEIIRLK